MTLFYTTWQSSMRAIIQQFGPPLKSVTLESYIPAPLSPSQIQVKMRYSTINPSDLITISGAYRSHISLPFIPGFEALQLSELLTERGQFINYGLLSGQPIPAQFWLERPDIDFSYFHLRQWIHASEKAVIQHKLNEVMQLVYEGIADTKISARFSLKEIHSALTYVQTNKGINKGKVLLTF